MTEQQLIDALRRLDAVATPDPDFKDALRHRLRESARVTSDRGTRSLRVAQLSAATLAVTVLAVVAALALRPGDGPGRPSAAPSSSSSVTSPVPTLAADVVALDVPFRLRVPDGLHLEINGNQLPSFVELIDGQVGEGQYGRSAGQADLALRGIEIASLRGAVFTHPCNFPAGGHSRVEISNRPPGFLDDLSRVGGMRISPPAQTTVGSRPAVSTRLLDASCDTADFHAGAGYVDLTIPSRLIVVDVDGVTVAIQVWGRSDAELAEWLPIAASIIESIEFE